MSNKNYVCSTPEETFELGVTIGNSLHGREAILLTGGLGAGKTLLTKGILEALDFDVDEVTSPSFTLVNLYKTPRFNVYHIDLWRIDPAMNAAAAVGLEEILEDENAVVIVEWAERLGDFRFDSKVINLQIEGEGDAERQVLIETNMAKQSPVQIRIVIKKAEGKLDLFDRESFVKTYNCAFGFASVGDKEIAGDGKTPEGEFYIFVKNDKSKFYLSLGVSYPNDEDAKRGLDAGLINREEYDEIIEAIANKKKPLQYTKLGGQIYIHGGGVEKDWTRGCIGLKDEDMRELFEAVTIGTPVTILS